jgi:hypothetical protein
MSPLWIRLSDVITQDQNSSSLDYLPKAEIGQLNIIYNVPHRSLMLHIHDKLTRNTSLIRTQENKREIVYRRMSLPPSARQVIDAAHLDSTISTIHWSCQVRKSDQGTTDHPRDQHKHLEEEEQSQRYTLI